MNSLREALRTGERIKIANGVGSQRSANSRWGIGRSPRWHDGYWDMRIFFESREPIEKLPWYLPIIKEAVDQPAEIGAFGDSAYLVL